ncbi:hypothetical protein DPMN_149621 [Dreissena polymorpha]|uniref:Tyrosine-protein kinase ephrin type A/B receptor-like domain-containing protein n=1 Tax=Dreissena polymorpha TaxID=45954 RepID=A0A9D4J199_DREPO|nr:hypothetical protein DPMN_149621 [Dreissena polymorpha]
MLACVHCSIGTYHDVDAGQCRPCPKGQYQPISRKTTCIECPTRTTTRTNGSIDADQCVDACPPGYISPTGTIPCSPCDVGSYSPVYGRTQCMMCPGSKTTRANVAATEIEECYDFDLEFSSGIYSYGNASVRFTPTSKCTNLYLNLWMHCSTCDRILEITDAHGHSVLRLDIRKGFIDATLHGCQTSIKSFGIIENPRWHSLGLYVINSNVTVTIDDKELYSPHTCTLSTLLEPEDYELTIEGLFFIGSVTALNLWDATSNDVELSSLQKCSDDNQGNNLKKWMAPFCAASVDAMMLTTVQVLLVRMGVYV